ncbi:hypothetical protein HD806DRAFT_543368 [Xylariaceae sp. AK1471]|nr:hypothetical protein HD806DRAFT_543368 [Xylariaceae sp. AK1471]
MAVHFDLPRTNVLGSTDCNIKITDRWPRKNWNKGPPPLPDNFESSNKLWRSFDSLQNLQARRTHHVSATPLRVPLEFLWDAAPVMVQMDVDIHTPESQQVWSFQDYDAWKADESLLRDFIEAKKERLQDKTYHFIPIDINQLPDAEEEEGPIDGDGDDDDDDDEDDDEDEGTGKAKRKTRGNARTKATGIAETKATRKARTKAGGITKSQASGKAGGKDNGQAKGKGRDTGKIITKEAHVDRWGLIVLHLVQFEKPDADDSDDEMEGVSPHNVLESYAVINPDYGEAARALEDDLAQRLLELLDFCGIDTTHADRKTPWVPPREYWSSGLRVFEMIRVWVDRLADNYCADPRHHDDVLFWGEQPGWFNPDYVRSNMIGMAASSVNQHMEGTTRIAIEPIIDKAIYYWPADEEIETVTMLPDRTYVRAYYNFQHRENPIDISENWEDL